MNKIIIIGCPGSGKSTFAGALHQKTKIPLYHLDQIYWKTDKTTISKEEFDSKLQSIMNTDQWIIDGNYSRTLEMRLKQCDTVFFFDIPTEMCLQGIIERKGKKRSDMPWVETEIDQDFLQFVSSFKTDSRPKIISLLERYAERNIYVFNSRTDADVFL